MAYIPTGITSIVNTIPSSVQVGASLMGQLPGVIAFPTADGGAIQNNLPVAAFNVNFNGTNWDRSRGNSSIGTLVSTGASSVITVHQGSVATVIIGGSIATATTNSSVMLLNGANTIGSITALQGTNPYVVTGSVQGTVSILGQLPGGTAVLGSIAALQGTNPWVVNFQNPSILAVPVGSTITVLQAPSIVGTYAEDAGHTTADKGLFTLAVRNDTIASTASADLDYTIHAVDSAGRTIVKPFASEDATIISYTGSVVSGSVTLIQASAIGKRSYITDFWIANTGAANTLVTFQDGSTSILGYTIAPTLGGSNSPGIAIPLKTAPSQDLAFKATTGTSILYLTVKGYQAP